MDKTIQGKSQKDIFFELSGILKLEDYKFKEDTTHQAYFPSATVFNKVRNLLGFNLETEAIPLPNGKLFDVTKECDQVVVSALVRTTIKYDDGSNCCSVSEIGSYAVAPKNVGGFMPIVDAVKSAQTVAKKLALLEFIKIPPKPKPQGQQNSNGDTKCFNLVISKAGMLLKNGMIKALATYNGKPKVLTIYKDNVSKIAGAINSNADAISASLKPGMKITVYGREQLFNNEEQIILKEFTGNVFPVPTDSLNNTPSGNDSDTTRLEGYHVCVTGDATLLDNGMIKVPCSLENTPIEMVIYSNTVKKISNEIRQQPDAVAAVFSNNKGKKISVLGELKDYAGKKQLIYRGVYKKGA